MPVLPYKYQSLFRHGFYEFHGFFSFEDMINMPFNNSYIVALHPAKACLTLSISDPLSMCFLDTSSVFHSFYITLQHILLENNELQSPTCASVSRRQSCQAYVWRAIMDLSCMCKLHCPYLRSGKCYWHNLT